jgi:hypothetical protein
MPLINVRLSAEDARKVKALRAEGVEISELVRAAINAAYVKSDARPRTAKQVTAMLKRIYERYPEPDGYQPTGVNTADRHAAAEYIRQRIRSRHPGKRVAG